MKKDNEQSEAKPLTAVEMQRGVRADDKIDYKFLNMDFKKFAESQEELTGQFSKGALARSIPNFKHGQVLIAMGHNHFSEIDAIFLCRKLTGLRP